MAGRGVLGEARSYADHVTKNVQAGPVSGASVYADAQVQRTPVWSRAIGLGEQALNLHGRAHGADWTRKFHHYRAADRAN